MNQDSFLKVYERIEAACAKCSRNVNDVNLIAVSKNQPAGKVENYINFCLANNKKIIIGENYVQEWSEKKKQLSLPLIESHMIGHLQSNKASQALKDFSQIQTVDSLKLVSAIAKEAKKKSIIASVWAQINISDDGAKYGVSSDDSIKLVEDILAKGLNFCGLMTITKAYQDPSEAQKDYNALWQLGEKTKTACGLSVINLSMGMSDDFEYAIYEGATHVRVGSALFGARD